MHLVVELDAKRMVWRQVHGSNLPAGTLAGVAVTPSLIVAADGDCRG
jgi:hypothetical protein